MPSSSTLPALPQNPFCNEDRLDTAYRLHYATAFLEHACLTLDFGAMKYEAVANLRFLLFGINDASGYLVGELQAEAADHREDRQ